MELAKTQSASTTQEIFSSSQVAIGTFLGGPIGAGFMLAHNFQLFQRFFAAWLSVGVGVGLGILLTWNLIFLPRDQYIVIVPLCIVALIVFCLVMAVIAQLSIDHEPVKVEAPVSELSWRWTIIVGITALVIQLGLVGSVFVVVLLSLASALD